MSRLKLKSIQMRNFGWVRDSSVTFPDRGFVLVTGRNLTGFESIGSGKTLLGEAISRALFNVPGRFTRFADYSTHRKGNTYVKVEVELDNQPLVVEAGYKCDELSKSGEGLRFTVGTQTPVMYGDIKETRKELTRMVGVTPDVASWTIFVDGDKLDFGALSESASVNLLMSVLNQPPWTEYHKKASAVLTRFKSATETALGSHSATKQTLDAVNQNLEAAKKNLEAAKTQYETLRVQWDQRRADRERVILTETVKLQDVQSKMREARKEINAAIEAEADAYKEAEQNLQKCNSIFADAQRQQSKAEREYGLITKAHEQLKAEKQKAITDYTNQAYAQLNEERNKLIAESRRIETQNSTSTDTWNKEERRLQRVLDEAEQRVALTAVTCEQAVSKFEKENNAPCVCPLPGCGKPWPKTNKKQLDSARKSMEEAQNINRTATEACIKAREVLFAFKQTQPVITPLPEIPAEQLQIPPFPHEDEWVNKIGEHAAQVMKFHERIAEAAVLVTLTEAQANDAKAKVDALKEASKVEQLSKKYGKLEEQQTELTSKIANLQEEAKQDQLDRSPVTNAETALNERQAFVQQCEQNLNAAAVELVECQEAEKAAAYWVEAYSAVGIPNMIINEAVGPLNSVSKRLSLRMTSGLLEVSYATMKQLKSGDISNELVITAVNKHGSSAPAGASKGEGGLLDLITAETLAEIGNTAARVGYRWYDEVVSSQDPTVRRSLFTYLKELAENFDGLVFIVDHSAEVASYCNRVLIAEKTAAGTTYLWQ